MHTDVVFAQAEEGIEEDNVEIVLENSFTKVYKGAIMDRLEAFEKMLADIQKQADYEKVQLKIMKEEGKEKTATYRQYLGNRIMYRFFLDKYQQYGLIEEKDENVIE